jgi:hypothetical protein
MAARTPKKRIQVIGVRRSDVDIERFAAAIIALAQHLRDSRDAHMPAAIAQPDAVEEDS